MKVWGHLMKFYTGIGLQFTTKLEVKKITKKSSETPNIKSKLSKW